ncbi:MAG: hypothetical protein KDD65_18175 [Bacteroidetes bacterium]|nr:hypothetical protein [Bacteroidota bacterium]
MKRLSTADSAAAAPSVSPTFSSRAAYVLPVILLIAGCYNEDPSNASTKPAFDRLIEQQAVHVQDSLRQDLGADQFSVVFHGDPRNPDTDASILELTHLDGETEYTALPADGSLPQGGHLTLHAPGGVTVLVDFRSTGFAPLAVGDTLIVNQDDASTVTSNARLESGHVVFSSTGGWTRLVRQSDSTLTGSFFYDLHSSEVSDQNWFQLVGVFGAKQAM